jgi:hypothetical protein
MHPSVRWATLVLCLAACKKNPPPAAPRFCDQDLSGVWLNASDRHYAYRFRDHGDVVRGEFLEAEEDGGLRAPDEPITFELHRTDTALAGVMRSTQPTQGGRECPVEFGIDVTVCNQRLQATVEMEAPIAEDCKRKTAEDGGELPTHRTEFVFVRDQVHPSGGGEGPVSH